MHNSVFHCTKRIFKIKWLKSIVKLLFYILTAGCQQTHRTLVHQSGCGLTIPAMPKIHEQKPQKCPNENFEHDAPLETVSRLQFSSCSLYATSNHKRPMPSSRAVIWYVQYKFTNTIVFKLCVGEKEEEGEQIETFMFGFLNFEKSQWKISIYMKTSICSPSFFFLANT